MSIADKEIRFWLERATRLEKTIDLAHEQGNDEQEEAHLVEYGQILGRMMREKDKLEDFRLRYNKVAGKLKLPLIGQV